MEKLKIAKIASKIVEEELEEADLYDKVWQAYAAVGDDFAVGVVGDERRYGNIVMIRVVDSTDAMTADWTRLPHGILEKISNRITNEIEEQIRNDQNQFSNETKYVFLTNDLY